MPGWIDYMYTATLVEKRILDLLDQEERCPAAVASASGGLVKVGTVYGAFSRMKDRGWVQDRPGKQQSRIYSLTDEGRHELSCWKRIRAKAHDKLPADLHEFFEW